MIDVDFFFFKFQQDFEHLACRMLKIEQVHAVKKHIFE